MKITIDKAGRVVIPKKFRARFHFAAGTQIELIAEPDSLKLRLPDSETRFEDKDGVLVQCADQPSAIDATAMINQLREARSLEPAMISNE